MGRTEVEGVVVVPEHVEELLDGIRGHCGGEQRRPRPWMMPAVRSVQLCGGTKSAYKKNTLKTNGGKNMYVAWHSNKTKTRGPGSEQSCQKGHNGVGRG